MKRIKSKNFLALTAILFVVGFSTSARSLMNYPTIFSFISFEVKPTPELPKEANPLFAGYPSTLKEHRLHTKDYVKKYSEKNREEIIYLFNKGKKFFPKAVTILEKYDVPTELRMLPVLESEFNANACSPVGAVGYWQFMSELGREYGLHISSKYDERKNFAKSTTAAAKFLRDQLDDFNGDVLLVVAAYNCGPGRVRSSIRKSGNPDAGFWEIKKFLPAETRRFVMNFVALNVISENYEKFVDRKLNFNELPLVEKSVEPEFAIIDSLNYADSIPSLSAL